MILKSLNFKPLFSTTSFFRALCYDISIKCVLIALFENNSCMFLFSCAWCSMHSTERKKFCTTHHIFARKLKIRLNQTEKKSKIKNVSQFSKLHVWNIQFRNQTLCVYDVYMYIAKCVVYQAEMHMNKKIAFNSNFDYIHWWIDSYPFLAFFLMRVWIYGTTWLAAAAVSVIKLALVIMFVFHLIGVHIGAIQIWFCWMYLSEMYIYTSVGNPGHLTFSL